MIQNCKKLCNLEGITNFMSNNNKERIKMIRYSDELIDEIKSSNDIVDTISQYVTLKRSGRSFFRTMSIS